MHVPHSRAQHITRHEHNVTIIQLDVDHASPLRRISINRLFAPLGPFGELSAHTTLGEPGVAGRIDLAAVDIVDSLVLLTSSTASVSQFGSIGFLVCD
jgi:hypothetical protein